MRRGTCFPRHCHPFDRFALRSLSVESFIHNKETTAKNLRPANLQGRNFALRGTVYPCVEIPACPPCMSPGTIIDRGAAPPIPHASQLYVEGALPNWQRPFYENCERRL